MKRKNLLTIFGFLLLVIAIGAVGFWYMSTQPLYKPRMVREAKNLSAPLLPPRQPADAETWIVEPGIELAHFAVGEGRNVLVIHGGPGMPFIQPMSGLQALTTEFQFHYYDQRGCGESTRPIDRFESTNVYENMITLDRTLGLGAQIADIERIRQILGDERLILIGHSWGGFLASLYASEFPEHVEALILISPANTLVMPQSDVESDLFESIRTKLPADQQLEFEAFMKEYMNFNTLFQKSDADLVAMNEQFGKYYVQVADIPEYMPEQGRSGGWIVWGMYISMGQRHDYRAALREVTAPALVIHGANDLQSEAASQQYAELLPNAEFVVIPNASHFVFEEQPQEFGNLVQEFLSTLE